MHKSFENAAKQRMMRSFGMLQMLSSRVTRQVKDKIHRLFNVSATEGAATSHPDKLIPPELQRIEPAQHEGKWWRSGSATKKSGHRESWLKKHTFVISWRTWLAPRL